MNGNTMGGIYLEPEKIIKNAEEIAEKSKNDEKFVFRIKYESAARAVVLAEISRLDCEIINQSDSDSTVTVRISMPQLAAIKTLNCIENVETVDAESISIIKADTAAEAISTVNVQMAANSAIAPLCYGGGSDGNGSNTMQTAHYLPLASWKEGCICCPDAEQWYRFTASISEADTYTIYTSGSLDTVGYLYDANGTLLASNDDSNGNRNFKITRQLTTGSRYYIKVKGFANNTGNYDLRVDYTIGSSSGGSTGSSGGSSCIDNSNTMQTAYHLPLLSWENNCLCCYGAEKWYKFTANASAAHKNGGSGKYNIRTSGPVILTGRLYDSNGSVIASNTAGYDGYGYYINAYLEYGETYYVLTTAKSPESFGNFCIYVGYDAVPTEPEYPFAGMKSAMNIVPNSSYYGSVRCAGAEVWFKFTPQYTRKYVIQTTGNTDTVGRIYNRQGELLGQDDDSGAALNFRKRMMLDAGTTYYIAVKAYGDKVGAFYINVTPIILVECIEIVASSTTLGVGGEISLGVKANPENATNREVVWESDNPSIATVSRNCGLVTGISVGTTTIRARAIDGSGMYGECVVTVDAPIPVSSVVIKPQSSAMTIGETRYLKVEVYPENATNKEVKWYSSDPNIISVINGRIHANRIGSAVITAKSHDGRCQDTLSVDVVIESVIIEGVLVKNDAGEDQYDTVYFTKTEKTWKCINRDMVFDDDNIGRNSLNERANHNFFIDYKNEQSTSTIRNYTDDEMRLLYAIDPYGVAMYVYTYANTIYSGNLPQMVAYKDRIFYMLFGRQPRHYRRTDDGKSWYETTDLSDTRAVMSESEGIFGMHLIWDDYSTEQLKEIARSFVEKLIFDAVDIVINKLPHNAWMKLTVLMLKSRKGGLLTNVAGEFISAAFEGTDLEFIYEIVTKYKSIYDFVNTFNIGGSYYPQIFDYYINKSDYEINLRMPSKEVISMKSAYQMLNK